MEQTPSPREMTLHPIGVIRNGCREKPEQWEEVESEIVVDEQLAEALEGIEEFSHIHVLFWLDRAEADRGSHLKVHPQRREDLPEVGLFATRSMFRPNPIGITVVRLLERKGNLLRVLGLDALDGTPLLDLKPYLTRGDCWPEATGPAWLRRLWGEEGF
ncbi:MAG: tRNA (N6-threonylcarbamoyladenosine(37)-N6)-methyltransferase TrmO [Chloroflexota bacterium]